MMDWEKGPFRVRVLPRLPEVRGHRPGFCRVARNTRTGQQIGVVVGRLFLRWRKS